jgi:hypothetical protein
MGFMDKAKKLAEQAQTKLDEAQKQFNQPGGAGGTGSAPAGGPPPVAYDNHGRPIGQPAPTPPAPPHGDPLAGSDSAVGPTPGMGTAPPAGAPAGPPVGPPTAPHGDPLAGQDAESDVIAGGQATAPPGPPPAAAPPADRGSQGAPEDRNSISYEPPKLSSGDPLAG